MPSPLAKPAVKATNDLGEEPSTAQMPPTTGRDPKPTSTSNRRRVAVAVVVAVVALLAIGLAGTVLPVSPVSKPDQPEAPRKKATGKTDPPTPPAKPVQPAPETDAEYQQLLAKARKPGPKRQRVAWLRQAVALNPEGDEAYARLAIELMESGKTRTEALDAAQKAIGLNPDSAIPWLAVGYINQMQGERPKALEAYKRCILAATPKEYATECRNLAPQLRNLR